MNFEDRQSRAPKLLRFIENKRSPKECQKLNMVYYSLYNEVYTT
jgi:hypothetical protein